MRRTIALAALLASILACTHDGVRGGPRTPTAKTSTLRPAPPDSPTPTPPRFAVRDSSWVSGSVGWVLGGAICGNKSCVAIMATIDAGRTWKAVGAPPAASLADEATGLCGPLGPCISSIRFADTSIGYAFGPAFYVTRDGARTWRPEPAALVLSLEISNGRAFRVVAATTGCPGPCDIRIESADVGSRTWQRLPAPRLDGAGAGLVVQGDRIYLAAFGNPAGGAEDAHTRFARSLDGGRTWRAFSDPCGYGPEGEYDASSFAAAPGGVLNVLCQSRLFPQARNFIVASTDSGRTFGRRRVLPAGATSVIAAGSARVIAVSTIRDSRFSVLVSHDGGRTWRVTLAVRGSEGVIERFFLGFQSELTARAAFAGSSLWTTRDAGETWRESHPFRAPRRARR